MSPAVLRPAPSPPSLHDATARSSPTRARPPSARRRDRRSPSSPPQLQFLQRIEHDKPLVAVDCSRVDGAIVAATADTVFVYHILGGSSASELAEAPNGGLEWEETAQLPAGVGEVCSISLAPCGRRVLVGGTAITLWSSVADELRPATAVHFDWFAPHPGTSPRGAPASRARQAAEPGLRPRVPSDDAVARGPPRLLP